MVEVDSSPCFTLHNQDHNHNQDFEISGVEENNNSLCDNMLCLYTAANVQSRQQICKQLLQTTNYSIQLNLTFDNAETVVS